MDTSGLLFLALFSYQLLLLQLHYSVSAADEESKTPWYKPGCQQQVFNCGRFLELKFPYTNETSPTCAPGRLDCSRAYPKLTLGPLIYNVKSFPTEETVEVIFPPLTPLKSSNSCDIFNYNISFPNSGTVSFTLTPNITLLKCSGNNLPPDHTMLGNHSCEFDTIYYSHKKGVHVTDHQTPPPGCDIITLPAAPDGDLNGDLFSQLASEFTIQSKVSTQCQDCISKGNRCSLNQPDFSCTVPDVKDLS